MSFAEAAAVPLGGLNALHFMRLARIEPGARVLINGAGGSIGAHAVQIAKAMGAEVTAVDSSLKEDLVRRLGAAHFVDYETESFSDKRRYYDVLFDMVPGSSYAECVRTLKPGGRYLSGNPRLSFMLRSITTGRFSGVEHRFAFARENKEELRALRDMIESDEVESIVDRVVGMDEAAEAHRLVETERRRGAIVIALD